MTFVEGGEQIQEFFTDNEGNLYRRIIKNGTVVDSERVEQKQKKGRNKQKDRWAFLKMGKNRVGLDNSLPTGDRDDNDDEGN